MPEPCVSLTQGYTHGGEIMEQKKKYAKVNGGLPFGESGICEVISHTPGHSIYVRIDPKTSPYKDQDFWQVMEGEYEFINNNEAV